MTELATPASNKVHMVVMFMDDITENLLQTRKSMVIESATGNAVDVIMKM